MRIYPKLPSSAEAWVCAPGSTKGSHIWEKIKLISASQQVGKTFHRHLNEKQRDFYCSRSVMSLVASLSISSHKQLPESHLKHWAADGAPQMSLCPEDINSASRLWKSTSPFLDIWIVLYENMQKAVFSSLLINQFFLMSRDRKWGWQMLPPGSSYANAVPFDLGRASCMEKLLSEQLRKGSSL